MIRGRKTRTRRVSDISNTPTIEHFLQHYIS